MNTQRISAFFICLLWFYFVCVSHMLEEFSFSRSILTVNNKDNEALEQYRQMMVLNLCMAGVHIVFNCVQIKI